MLQLHKRVLTGVVALLAVCSTPTRGSSGTPSSAAFMQTTTVGAGGPPVASSANLPRMPRYHHPLAAGSLVYTIADVGAPASKTYSSASPLGFNNTGQMFGIGTDPSKAERDDCIVYTGHRFVSGSGSQGIASCLPASISDATTTASGTPTVWTVGSVTSVYSPNSTAFEMTLNPSSGGLSYSVLSTSAASEFTGVTASGQAVGQYYYDPAVPLFTLYPAITYSAATKKAVLLQPGCTADPVPTGCFSIFGGYTVVCSEIACTLVCPFGGCTINSAGEIIGVSNNDGYYTIASTNGGAAQDLRALPTIQCMLPPELNNANQLVFAGYSACGPSGGLGILVSQIYDVAAGTLTPIPAFANDPSECTNYIPISFSNLGEVLGYTTNCQSGPSFYFTYDPTNGTQNLSNEFPSSPAYRSIVPQGVNDNGQILVALSVASTGAIHWGTLNLSSANSSLLRRRKRSVFRAGPRRP